MVKAEQLLTQEQQQQSRLAGLHFFPAQVGPPTLYALHRKSAFVAVLIFQALMVVGWSAIVVQVGQHVQASQDPVYKALSWFTPLGFGLVIYGIPVALGVLVGWWAWKENMNITYICWWGVFSLAGLILCSWGLLFVFPLALFFIGFSCLCGCALAWWLYVDYENEHQTTDLLSSWLRHFGALKDSTRQDYHKKRSSEVLVEHGAREGHWISSLAHLCCCQMLPLAIIEYGIYTMSTKVVQVYADSEFMNILLVSMASAPTFVTGLVMLLFSFYLGCQSRAFKHGFGSGAYIQFTLELQRTRRWRFLVIWLATISLSTVLCGFLLIWAGGRNIPQDYTPMNHMYQSLAVLWSVHRLLSDLKFPHVWIQDGLEQWSFNRSWLDLLSQTNANFIDYLLIALWEAQNENWEPLIRKMHHWDPDGAAKTLLQQAVEKEKMKSTTVKFIPGQCSCFFAFAVIASTVPFAFIPPAISFLAIAGENDG